VAALAVAAVLAGCGSQATAQSASPPAGTPFASAASSPLPSGMTADLAAAVAGLALPATTGQEITAANLKTSGDWTSITAGPSTGDPARPIGPFTVVIGHRVNGVWTLVSERDGPAFCAALDAAPSDLGTATIRDYYGGCR
jgi:hypothetical protein